MCVCVCALLLHHHQLPPCPRSPLTSLLSKEIHLDTLHTLYLSADYTPPPPCARSPLSSLRDCRARVRRVACGFGVPRARSVARIWPSDLATAATVGPGRSRASRWRSSPGGKVSQREQSSAVAAFAYSGRRHRLGAAIPSPARHPGSSYEVMNSIVALAPTRRPRTRRAARANSSRRRGRR